MSVTRKSALLLTLPVFGLLLWLVLYPNLFVLWRSLVSDNRFTLAHYAAFFSSPSQMEALGNSLFISLGSVLLSALIGVPLAFVFHRFDFPGRRIFAALASLPVLLPPLVGVDRLPFSLWRERHPDPQPPDAAGPVRASLFPERHSGHPVGARLHHVRLLLPVRLGRAQAPGRIAAGGFPFAGSLPHANLSAGDAAGAHSRHGGVRPCSPS